MAGAKPADTSNVRGKALICAVVALVAAASPARATPEPNAPSCPILPADNVWHADVSSLPVHARSANWIASMGGSGVHIHPDFGPSGSAQPYGIPYNVVAGSHQKVSIDFYYPDESDPGPYPLGTDITIEEGSDHHALMLDKDACKLYEVFDVSHDASGWHGGSGAIFDLNSDALRPAGWTSADAAGLPIFAGLIRRDEITVGVIDHAIRVTASRTDRSYLWPARHQAGAADDPTLPPMGARFRLKASFDTSSFSSEARIVLDAMKRYGLIVADNGSNWFFGGASQDGWTNSVLDELKSVTSGSFEAVDESSLMVSPDSAQARTGPQGTLSIGVRPSAAVYGTTFTLSGSLACDGSALGSAAITIGGLHTATASDGTWSVAVRPASTTSYRASWSGGGTCTGGALSSLATAGVRVGITLNQSAPRLARGSAVTLSGRVLPAHAGRKVMLQMLSSGSWRTIATTTLDGSSSYRFGYRKTSSGYLLFRTAFATQDGDHLWNVSRSVRVDWR